MARPPFQVTKENRNTVKALAGYGLAHDQIARIIGLRSSKTLRKHFRKELDTGAAEAGAQVAQTLYQMATSGQQPAATMFWAKTRLRWRETTAEDIRPAATPTLTITGEAINEERRS